ncbi:hypothetical protein E2P81_ATG06692 [Venturia nashicola]|uniref:Uncharacterized protein n=1 Tax=Venturia nashicola TaxID=86259 RepID=A0A4Z1NXM3_9PEZI|nr:hypothetical protein E6O75_ATG06863 [Venturia nashicola]TLD30039.1 hypothetical protein E2P81_ATG06692 [Venturia nashicola]
MLGIGKLRPNRLPKDKPVSPRKSKHEPSVRPRGRPRKLPRTFSSQAVMSSQDLPQYKSLQPTVERPLKRAKRTKGPKGRELSSFERLPLELLEKIFLDSLNPNLPLCSRHLESQLSRDLLKCELTMNILCRRRDELGDAERGRLLACRFFTWEFIVRYTQWAHKQGILIEGLDDYPCLNASERSVRTYEERLDEHLESLRDDQGCIPFNHRIVFQEEFPPIDETFPHLAGLKTVAIPEKLLRGPWNDDVMRFLRLTVLSWCTLDWLGTSTGEVAIQGTFDAIRHGENEVLTYFFHTSTVNVPPTTEMLRTAIVDAGCDLGTVYQILSGSSGMAADHHIDVMDNEIWHWIDAAKRRGDSRADRLTNMLREKAKKDTLDAADYDDLWSKYREPQFNNN